MSNDTLDTDANLKGGGCEQEPSDCESDDNVPERPLLDAFANVAWMQSMAMTSVACAYAVARAVLPSPHAQAAATAAAAAS